MDETYQETYPLPFAHIDPPILLSNLFVFWCYYRTLKLKLYIYIYINFHAMRISTERGCIVILYASLFEQSLTLQLHG